MQLGILGASYGTGDGSLPASSLGHNTDGTLEEMLKPICTATSGNFETLNFMTVTWNPELLDLETLLDWNPVLEHDLLGTMDLMEWTMDLLGTLDLTSDLWERTGPKPWTSGYGWPGRTDL